MKQVLLIVITLMMMFSASALWAGDENATIPTKQKVSTLIIAKYDWLKPQNSEGFSSYATSLYWNYDNWLGFGVDATSRPKFDYLELKPYLTVNKGPYYLLAGFATDSTGSDYFQAGFWYYNLHLDKKMEVFIDLRNYWATSSSAKSYTDNYAEITYLVGKFAVGPAAFFDHWWNEDRDILSAGVITYYKLNKNIIPYVRYLHDWNRSNKDTSELDRFRVAVKICF